jgi:hypothetical protein
MGCFDMRPIGFSTGALAFGDFRKALDMLATVDTPAVELSALRDNELLPLMQALGSLDLRRFRYVSIHVPSKFKLLSEAQVASALLPCIDLSIPLVIHPDAMRDRAVWAPFGRLLCLENMDKRKHTGRTIAELDDFFSTFPNATFCLDIAHARQVDSTMMETRQMLRRFGDRLRQVHISEIDAEGHHHSVSLATILASNGVASMIDHNVPIIIESVIAATQMKREIDAVRRALTPPSPGDSSSWESRDWGELA